MFWIEVIDQVLRHTMQLTLDGFGVYPRTAQGLVGILFSPLLHGSVAHLLANALPLFLLLVLLYADPRYRPGPTLTCIWIGSGLGTWLIGRPGSVHIGASSLIFGLVAFLIASGFVVRSWRAALVGVVVAILFGGIFYGVLPQQGPISWEGHLSGVIAGILAVRFVRR